MNRTKRFLKDLDLQSWDNWLPLAVIFLFVVLGGVFASGQLQFRLVPGDIDKFETLYTDVGIGATSGIYGLIVTLSLVAIQFASQEYSHRIMDYYVKSVMFWSTNLVYLSLMIVAIILLTNASPEDSVQLPSMIVVGSILALVLLIPHYLITAAYLKPEFIISKLLRRVDRAYLVSITDRLQMGRERLRGSDDRLLPVVEIIERSIDRGDLTTTRTALEQLHVTYTTQAESLNSLPIERFFLDYLLRIGRKAVSEADEEEAAVQAILLIGTVGSRGPAATVAVEDIEILGFTGIKQDAEPVINQMIDSLRRVSDSTHSAEARKAVLDVFRNMVDDLAGKEMGRPLRHLATNVREMAQAAMEKQDASALSKCLDILESIGHSAGTRNLFDVVQHVTEVLQSLGLLATRENEDAAERMIRTLLRIERVVMNTERELFATIEFAKGDIEKELVKKRGPSPKSVASAPVAAQPKEAAKEPALPAEKGPEDKDFSDFSDLWGEKKN